MMQRETSAPAPRAKPRGLFAYVAAEAPTVAGIVTTIPFFTFQDAFFADLSNYPRTIFMFVWLFGGDAVGRLRRRTPRQRGGQ